jgi:hypothetical protein
MPTNDTSLAIQKTIEIWNQNQTRAGLSSASDESLPLDFQGTGGPEEEGLALAIPEPERHPVIVAEGDSWFDYPVKGDLLDALRKRHGYTIYEASKAGALMEDMVYGVEREFWGSEKPQIFRTVDLVVRHRPSLVLISGGGNDLAGPELSTVINRKAAGVPALRTEVIDYLIFNVLRRAYEVFIGTINQVANDLGFSVQILGHSYDFPNPDGRGYSITNVIPGFSFVGPWLKPSFDRKGFSVGEGQAMLVEIMTKLRTMQEGLEQRHPNFSAINFQGTLKPDSLIDWDNELHPTWSGFTRLAALMDEKIQTL